MTSPSELLDAANALKSIGWPVFPLMPRGKTPVTRNGVLDYKDLTPPLIDAWWHLHPTCNIGLATGILFDVVDIDGDPGEAALETALPGYVHTGPEATTGRGRHLYFTSSDLRNTANPERKIDFRGHHGYVVAPPSTHPDGHQYRWTTPPGATLPQLPAALRIALGTSPHREPNQHRLNIDTAINRNLDIRSLIERIYPPRQWHRKGDLYRAICPFHGDGEPSFTVYPDNHYHCFGCGAHGWAHHLVRKEGQIV